ncbi:SCP2 sterol-binding domain-containing protein [Paenibacillus sp. BSR1-1]|uniref:SCP2 sterol-binding domain-containing protein n=1 Tax=Paenibacillus sp. BSR1-1 TaxID=3020845 RepID=UPI0025B185E6|nr:SCP2 sterol-binding domain-containing protein [Paenibacillus sp. BSR1-1]MDN3017589.1 SCP2 sterol-binding domain-containing protein [Paenibacillus sp. BSR1-1]
MAKAIQAYTLPELMTRIEEIFNANPAPIKGFEAIVQYDIHGEAEGSYQHFFHDGTLTIKEGIEASPNVIMALSYDNFKKFLLGKQSGTMALLTGKVKAKGDISTGMKIESILRKYKIKEPL